MLIIHYSSSRWEIDHEQVTCQRKLGSFSRGHLTWSQLIGPSLKSSIIAFVVLAWLFSLYSLLVNHPWVHDPPTSTDTSEKAINQSSRKKVEWFSKKEKKESWATRRRTNIFSHPFINWRFIWAIVLLVDEKWFVHKSFNKLQS